MNNQELQNQNKIRKPTTTINNMDTQAKSKWSCIKCELVIQYNPRYYMSNTLQIVAAFHNAD
jgi:hypothetical protein